MKAFRRSQRIWGTSEGPEFALIVSVGLGSILRLKKRLILVFMCMLYAACTSPKPAVTEKNSSNSNTGSSTGGTTGSTAGSTTGSTTGSSATDYFPPDSVWYQDVSISAPDSESTQITQWLENAGGWGTGTMRVDFSFNILRMDSSTPFVPIVKNSGYYEPDCETLSGFPLPDNGAIEGEEGYTCTTGGDCHILVHDPVNKRLYESYISSVVGGRLTTQCAIVWDLNRIYPANGRGEQCTSTDAAGFPIAPLLFTADEIAAGEIKHAIRFILPNNRMRAGLYVHPASHAGAPSASGMAPIYGMRFRLKSTFNVNSLKPSARVVARALQRYGMLLPMAGTSRLPLQVTGLRLTNGLKWILLPKTSTPFVQLISKSLTQEQEFRSPTTVYEIPNLPNRQ